MTEVITLVSDMDSPFKFSPPSSTGWPYLRAVVVYFPLVRILPAEKVTKSEISKSIYSMYLSKVHYDLGYSGGSVHDSLLDN